MRSITLLALKNTAEKNAADPLARGAEFLSPGASVSGVLTQNARPIPAQQPEQVAQLERKVQRIDRKVQRSKREQAAPATCKGQKIRRVPRNPRIGSSRKDQINRKEQINQRLPVPLAAALFSVLLACAALPKFAVAQNSQPSGTHIKLSRAPKASPKGLGLSHEQLERGHLLSANDPAIFELIGPAQVQLFAFLVLEAGTVPQRPALSMSLDGRGRPFPLKTPKSSTQIISDQPSLASLTLSEATVVQFGVDANRRELKLELPKGAKYRVVVGLLGIEPEQSSEQRSERALGQTQERTQEQASERIPEQTSERTPQQTPEQTPEQAPEQTPEQAPERTSAQTPEQSPEQSPGLRSKHSQEQRAVKTPTIEAQPRTLENESAEREVKARVVEEVDPDDDDPLALLDAVDPLAELELVPIAPLSNQKAAKADAKTKEEDEDWFDDWDWYSDEDEDGDYAGYVDDSGRDDSFETDALGFVLSAPADRSSIPPADRHLPAASRSQPSRHGPGSRASFFHQVEVQPKAGYTLGRSQLAGTGLYQLELSTRLDALKAPFLRASLSLGYAGFAGAWMQANPQGIHGRVHQNSLVLPIDLGVVAEPWRFGVLSPYLGVFFSTGYAHNSVRQFSLAEESSSGMLVAFSASLGLKVRLGSVVLLAELRQSEGQSFLSETQVGQEVLSSTAIMGGLGWVFR